MAELPHPTPAWSKTRDSDALLDTRVPRRLTRTGYRPTWPTPDEVVGVEGVPSDANVPVGEMVALNTETGSLYRKTDQGWQSANGEM